jgi:formylglycine-generating enzyme required for sulfatase activity
MKRFLAICLLALSGIAFSVRAAEETTYTNSIGMEFVLIPAGSFVMGADADIEDAFDDEIPQHPVTISQPFFLGTHEVTQDQWKAVMGNNPSRFRGGSNPVERVSWDDVQTFIERLNRKEGTKYRLEYRLPTEAEWEYAARAGTTSTYSFGDDPDSLGQYAWYVGNSGDEPHPVGQKRPNPWGLYDMHGNVWEWVQDWFGEDYYATSPTVDPRGPSGGPGRALRGGGWGNGAKYLRSAYRGRYSPGSRGVYRGFRLAFSPIPPEPIVFPFEAM